MENQFTKRYICITGNISKRLQDAIKNCNPTKLQTIVTRDTHYIIIGDNPNEENMRKLKILKHDGLCPIILSISDALNIINNNTDDYYTDEIKRNNISIDSSFYNWASMLMSGTEKEAVSKVSSPVQYDEEGAVNPFYQKEIYIPGDSTKISILRQLIGNQGGFANSEVSFDAINANNNTNIIVLTEESYVKLMNNEKDEVILSIENAYNKSNAEFFNVQFTKESDIINWIERRIIYNKEDNQSSNSILLQHYKSN